MVIIPAITTMTNTWSQTVIFPAITTNLSHRRTGVVINQVINKIKAREESNGSLTIIYDDAK